MKFIQCPKCTTCQKAKKWLDDRGIRHEDCHIKGMLVKRPLVVGEDFVLVGFKEKDWEERLA